MIRAAALSLVAVALAACSLVAVADGPREDLSQWSRVPLPPDPALTARSSCGRGQNGRALPFLFQDRRTPASAVVVYGAGNEYELCSVSGGSGHAFGMGGLGMGVPDPVTISTGLATLGDERVTLAEGQVTRAAARVEVERADGIVVVASHGGGRWAAWWPGEAAAVRAIAYDASGKVIGRARPPEIRP